MSSNFEGIITLNGDEIGDFEINQHDITVKLKKISDDLGEVLEFAAENGMTLSLTFQPDFETGIPQRSWVRQDSVNL